MYIYILFFCIADIKKGNYLNGGGGAIGGYSMATGCFLRTRQQIVSNFGIVS